MSVTREYTILFWVEEGARAEITVVIVSGRSARITDHYHADTGQKDSRIWPPSGDISVCTRYTSCRCPVMVHTTLFWQMIYIRWLVVCNSVSSLHYSHYSHYSHSWCLPTYTTGDTHIRWQHQLNLEFLNGDVRDSGDTSDGTGVSLLKQCLIMTFATASQLQRRRY